MIKIVFGNDRGRAEREAKRSLGEDYEVFDGEKLKFDDLPNIFFGTSLFGDRSILIKDLSVNKECFELVKDYVKTPFKVVIWEENLDKRTSCFRELKKVGVEMVEFKKAEEATGKEVFDIFDVAFRDPSRAVKMIEKIEKKQDPFMYFGLLVTQAIRRYEMKRGAKEKRVLLELSKIDILMKSSSFQAWDLIKGFILRISSL